jgi:hypothetical protein
MAEDQTEASWIEQYGTNVPGTGVFFQLKDSGDDFTIIFARDVTYERSLAIADDYGYAAFKWVPLKVATYAHVKGSRCASEGENCVRTCRGVGCICHTSRRVCVSAAAGGGSLEEMQPAEAGQRGLEYA